MRNIEKINCKNRTCEMLNFVVAILFVFSPAVLHAMDTEIEADIYNKLLKNARYKLGFDGQEQVIERLVREVILPLVAKETANKFGIKPTKGILLYGLPGTGKSYFAENLGEFIPNSVVHKVNGPELQCKDYGETPRKLRELFESAKKEPLNYHIFIFDEFDSIGRKRTGTVAHHEEKNDAINQLLVLIDGLESPTNILVVGITNRKDDLDDALIREGRFETHIEVPNCNALGRAKILGILLQQLGDNWLIEDIDTKFWAKELDGYTPAALNKFVNDAKRRAMSEKCYFAEKFHLTAEIFQKVSSQSVESRVPLGQESNSPVVNGAEVDAGADRVMEQNINPYNRHLRSAFWILGLGIAQTFTRLVFQYIF